jgi:hypothetical protein
MTYILDIIDSIHIIYIYIPLLSSVVKSKELSDSGGVQIRVSGIGDRCNFFPPGSSFRRDFISHGLPAPCILKDNEMNFRVNKAQQREEWEQDSSSSLPFVPFLHAWVRPHLQRAVRWSLFGHLIFALIAWHILARMPKEKPRRVVRIVRYSDLLPPPSLTEKEPVQETQGQPPPAQRFVPGEKVVPRVVEKAPRTGRPVAVKDAAAPRNEEWRPAREERPPEEDLSVSKSSFQEARQPVSVRPDLDKLRRISDTRAPEPEARVRAASRVEQREQRDQQRVTVVKLSVLGGYSGASGKITYIQRTLGDRERASFSFRDATIDALRNQARVRFENGRTFAVYFGSDWRLGRIEIDLESDASDKAKEIAALRAIDFLEKALRSQSS